MPKQGKQGARRTQKLRSSITIRLNLQLFGHQLWRFFILDLALILVLYAYYRPYVRDAGLTAWQLLERTLEQPIIASASQAGVMVPLSLVVLIVLIVQGLVLIFGLFTNSGIIRKSLQPIEELANTAEVLNSVSTMSEEELKNLVGSLDEIGADDLHARIKVQGTQRELQALAHAINGLLDRVGAAYDAQARFVSDASHELRTPVAVIQGYADLLYRWGKEDPETRDESIEAIRAETANMKEILEELLFLARGDNNSTKLEPEDFDASDMAKEIVREYEMIDQTHPYLLDVAEGCLVHADPGLIKQAMRVLVDNAMKYTPEGGRILVALQDCGREIRLSVEDEGQGISAADLPHVFDRFFRTDESRTRQTGGTGLGLSIAKWIVDRHSGYFEVVSRVNVGTRFTIVLPAKKQI